MRRKSLELSREKLGEKLGISFQQIQKYECGNNRIGSSRLYDLAVALNVSVDFFFAELPAETMNLSPASLQNTNATESDTVLPTLKHEAQALVNVYYRISDPFVRKRVYELAKSLGSLDIKLT